MIGDFLLFLVLIVGLCYMVLAVAGVTTFQPILLLAMAMATFTLWTHRKGVAEL